MCEIGNEAVKQMNGGNNTAGKYFALCLQPCAFVVAHARCPATLADHKYF